MLSEGYSMSVRPCVCLSVAMFSVTTPNKATSQVTLEQNIGGGVAYNAITHMKVKNKRSGTWSHCSWSIRVFVTMKQLLQRFWERLIGYLASHDKSRNVSVRLLLANWVICTFRVGIFKAVRDIAKKRKKNKIRMTLPKLMTGFQTCVPRRTFCLSIIFVAYVPPCVISLVHVALIFCIGSTILLMSMFTLLPHPYTLSTNWY